jgi:DNA-binding transcriptional LysR family regulator
LFASQRWAYFIVVSLSPEVVKTDNIVPSMEQLNPNDLLIFARVAEAGSFSRAAERLGLPKSTVSRRIAQLEELLGERLMVRSTRRSTFTEFGLQLLEHARLVADEVDSVTALSAHRQVQPTGRLRVSMPGEVAVLFLQDMLAAFLALHPAVSLELDLSARRVDLLAEGFDIALRFGDLADDAQLAARRLAEIPNGLYAASSYLSEYGEPVSPDDLKEHKGVLMLGRNYEPLEWTLTKDGQRWEGAPQSNFSANSMALLVRMALNGTGIVAAPDRFAEPHVRTGALRRVLPDWEVPSVPAWAVFVGRRLMPSKTRAFIDMLQHALNDEANGP